jgi:hypothetical protein
MSACDFGRILADAFDGWCKISITLINPDLNVRFQYKAKTQSQSLKGWQNHRFDGLQPK